MPGPDYRWLHRLADRQVPAFAGAIETAVKGLARQVTDDAVAVDLGTGEPVRTLSVLDGWQVTKQKQRDPEALYAETIAAAAAETVSMDLADSFTLTSPLVMQEAERLAGHMIVDVKQSTRDAVRRTISDAWRDGLAPRESAVLIRQVIGLDKRRAIALGNYARAQSGASGGANRDKRILAYSRRLVKDRALTIARTETMRAANAGVQLGWQEMVNAGHLPASMRQQWITTPDDRLCDLCAPMSGQEIMLQGEFQSTVRGVLPSDRVPYAGGNVEQPPLHPSCRCTLSAAFG